MFNVRCVSALEFFVTVRHQMFQIFFSRGGGGRRIAFKYFNVFYSKTAAYWKIDSEAAGWLCLWDFSSKDER